MLVGVVRDISADPIDGASVQALMALGHNCEIDVNTLTARPTPAVSDAHGEFSIRLYSHGGEGVHCVDLSVNVGSSGAADTLRDVRVEFRDPRVPPDTVSIDIRFGG
jgi:hypothetical protein